MNKKPTSAQRKQIAQFIDSAYEGNYDVVYLTEIKRTTEDDDLCLEHNQIQDRCRFGKPSQRDLIHQKRIFASKQEKEADPLFKTKVKIAQGFHFFNSDDPNRKTVESENIRCTFEFARDNNQLCSL